MTRVKIILASIALMLLSSWTVAAQSQVVQVFNSQGVRIGPGKYFFVNFHVDMYLRRARLAGNVLAQGGGGNDIVVQVVKDGRVIFDSGQQRSIVLSVPLAEPGQYSLILSNKFSIVSSKVVWGYVNLYSDGEDTVRSADELRLQQNRQLAGRTILGYLYRVLEANERHWYTRQVPIEPSLFVTRDHELNAHADVNTNRIFVNSGVFEAADSLKTSSPAKARDMIAGVIGHELAHIFYRHPGDQSSGLWGELKGALPIDRQQERQADVLGTFLACQAGYGPEGLADFMRLLIATQGDHGDFGVNHPSSAERIAMIEQVARQCPATGR